MKLIEYQKLINTMEQPKKIDGRKFNRGHKGLAGRKPKAVEIKLQERLEDASDEIIELLKKKALEGDKDMIKLYLAYYAGNPKIKTENETSMTVSDFDIKSLISFKNDDSSDNFFDDEDLDNL